MTRRENAMNKLMNLQRTLKACGVKAVIDTPEEGIVQLNCTVMNCENGKDESITFFALEQENYEVECVYEP